MDTWPWEPRLPTPHLPPYCQLNKQKIEILRLTEDIKRMGACGTEQWRSVFGWYCLLQRRWIVSVLLFQISRRTDVVWELRRQLMATEDEDSLSYPPLNMTTGNETCILFYASNFSLTANGSVPIDLTNATFVTRNVDISSSECSDANTTWVVQEIPYHNMCVSEK